VRTARKPRERAFNLGGKRFCFSLVAACCGCLRCANPKPHSRKSLRIPPFTILLLLRTVPHMDFKISGVRHPIGKTHNVRIWVRGPQQLPTHFFSRSAFRWSKQSIRNPTTRARNVERPTSRTRNECTQQRTNSAPDLVLCNTTHSNTKQAGRTMPTMSAMVSCASNLRTTGKRRTRSNERRTIEVVTHRLFGWFERRRRTVPYSLMVNEF